MSYELTIEPIGQTIEVEDDQTILDAALRAGIWLPHACCHGLCATCKVQVVDGGIGLAASDVSEQSVFLRRSALADGVPISKRGFTRE